MTAAIDGTNFATCRSFKLTIAASSANAALDRGSYYLVATSACWAAFGATNAVVAAAAPSSQPAVGSPNGIFYIPAGVPFPLDANSAGYLAVIQDSTGGTLAITGPIGNSPNP